MTLTLAVRSRPGSLALVALLVGACAGETGTLTAGPASPAAPTVAAQPTSAPDPTPNATVIDGATVTTLSLGPNTAPVDVVSAFGSLWVAGHHSNAVSRLDPTTMQEVERIKVGSGPGWFAVTDDAIWVTSQMGRGLNRIDPATNAADIKAGDWPTCGGPVVFHGSIWQMACDAGVIMRIDLGTNTSTDIYASGYLGVGLIGETLVAVGPDAISRIDPATNELERIGDGGEGFPAAFDEQSVWLAGDAELTRVVADGSVLGTVPIGGETAVTVAGARAWVTQSGLALHEVDVATGRVVRTLHLYKPSVAREINGLLWVTSFDANSLSYLKP